MIHPYHLIGDFIEIKNPDMKELVIHHVYKVDTDELAKLSISTSNAMHPLFWHDGVLFFYHQIPLIMNPEVTKDYISGREHWEEAYYSELGAYRDSIEIEDGGFKGAKVRVVKASGFSPHKEFVEWVKKQI